MNTLRINFSNKNRLVLVLVSLLTTTMVFSQSWIWYPGDYEIWLGNEMNNRRTERGAFFPHFWKMDTHYNLVEFSKEIDLQASEEIEIRTEGKFNLKLDGKMQFGMPHQFILPAGKHKLNIKIWNQASPPTLYVKGKTVFSDSSWKVTFEDKEWIDESGKASDNSATTYMQASTGNFNSIDTPPSTYKLETMRIKPFSVADLKEGKLYDFGKETFGFVQIHGLKGNGKVQLFYGESKEEALDTAFCETLDKVKVESYRVTDLATNQVKPINGKYTLENSKAFRYVYVVTDNQAEYSDLDMLYEYKPEVQRGYFRCDDEKINKIWDIGAYTMQLTTREFFIDGIKRDRWTWSGDAIQSYLMNYYLFFDTQTVKNTIWLLRGKDPVTSHTNTIMDYTFYWFLSIYDYYMFTGDKEFIQQIYPRMQSMMDYVLNRTNKNGMVEGQTGDWVFVDWADGYLDKHGELSYEQILFAKSLETMALCSKLANNKIDEGKYQQLFDELFSKLETSFWSENHKALVHNRINGVQQEVVTRYSNMFAIFYNYLSDEKKNQIKHSVLLNDSILGISTPYMRFYELEALCALGEHESVTKEIRSYWGGMLDEGATSFWEKYNPKDKGTEHLAMYGRPYGKSLCHAWGASPIYLLSKYYLGVKPEEAGYSAYSIRPNLGGLKWIEGAVPTPKGEIKVFMDQKSIRVSSDEGQGTLYFNSKSKPKISKGKAILVGNGLYELKINAGESILVSYK